MTSSARTGLSIPFTRTGRRFDEAEHVDHPGKARDSLAGEDLAGPRDAAQAGGEVQGAAAVTAFDRDGLAGRQADADSERESGLTVHVLPEAALQLDGSAERLSGGLEDAQSLVAAELEHLLRRSRRRPRGRARRTLAASLPASSSPWACVKDV